MAVLTADDYRALRDSIYRAGFGKEELKARPGLPSKAQLLAAFQSIEDFFEANRTVLKTGIDTAIGFTTTAALARKIVLTWLIWKVGIGG